MFACSSYHPTLLFMLLSSPGHCQHPFGSDSFILCGMPLLVGLPIGLHDKREWTTAAKYDCVSYSWKNLWQVTGIPHFLNHEKSIKKLTSCYQPWPHGNAFHKLFFNSFPITFFFSTFHTSFGPITSSFLRCQRFTLKEISSLWTNLSILN